MEKELWTNFYRIWKSLIGFNLKQKTVTVKLVGYEEASDQYAVQNKDIMEYLSLEELLNSMEKEQIFEVDDLVQQGTVSHLSDEDVMIKSDMEAFQISLEDFKAKLKEESVKNKKKSFWNN